MLSFICGVFLETLFLSAKLHLRVCFLENLCGTLFVVIVLLLLFYFVILLQCLNKELRGIDKSTFLHINGLTVH